VTLLAFGLTPAQIERLGDHRTALASDGRTAVDCRDEIAVLDAIAGQHEWDGEPDIDCAQETFRERPCAYTAAHYLAIAQYMYDDDADILANIEEEVAPVIRPIIDAALAATANDAGAPTPCTSCGEPVVDGTCPNTTPPLAEDERLAEPGNEPDSITTLTKNGWLVTVIDRPPLKHESGWWVPWKDRPLGLAPVLRDLLNDFDGCDRFGWTAPEDKQSDPNDECGWCVTVVTKRENNLEVVPAADLGIAGAPAPDLWSPSPSNNLIQFARLLCEIEATGDGLDINALSDSMDLEPAEVCELFDRAHEVWEDAKSALVAKGGAR